MHAFDGYSDDDISEMAKKNPSVRSDYAKTQRMKARYRTKKPSAFPELEGIKRVN